MCFCSLAGVALGLTVFLVLLHKEAPFPSPPLPFKFLVSNYSSPLILLGYSLYCSSTRRLRWLFCEKEKPDRLEYIFYSDRHSLFSGAIIFHQFILFYLPFPRNQKFCSVQEMREIVVDGIVKWLPFFPTNPPEGNFSLCGCPVRFLEKNPT